MHTYSHFHIISTLCSALLLTSLPISMTKFTMHAYLYRCWVMNMDSNLIQDLRQPFRYGIGTSLYQSCQPQHTKVSFQQQACGKDELHHCCSDTSHLCIAGNGVNRKELPSKIEEIATPTDNDVTFILRVLHHRS